MSMQKISWLMFFLYRNIGSGSNSASITRFQQLSPGAEVVQVRIDVKRPWVVAPGEYIYITLPRLRTFGLSILESHPFMLAWPQCDVNGKLKSIVLLVQLGQGLTRRLALSGPTTPVLVDGPYGGTETRMLANYDKILLVSSGIGLSAHLSIARHLLLAHDCQTARVRRLTLVWLLETQGICPPSLEAFSHMSTEQMEWAEEFLCALDDIDSRHILTIFLYYPNDVEGSLEGSRTRFKAPRKRMLCLNDTLDVSWLLEKEWGAEAGNMLIMGKSNLNDAQIEISNTFDSVWCSEFRTSRETGREDQRSSHRLQKQCLSARRDEDEQNLEL
jgi:hypothetical protein